MALTGTAVSFATLNLQVVNQGTFVEEAVTLTYIQRSNLPQAANYTFLLEKETSAGHKYFERLVESDAQESMGDYRLIDNVDQDTELRTILKFRRDQNLEGNLLILRTTVDLFQQYIDGQQNTLETQLDLLALFSREMQRELSKTAKFSDSTGRFTEVMKTLVPRIETVLGFRPVPHVINGVIQRDNNNEVIMIPKLDLLHWSEVGEDTLEVINDTIEAWALEANPTIPIPIEKIADGTIVKDKLSSGLKDIAEKAVLVDGIDISDRDISFSSDTTTTTISTPGIEIEEENSPVGLAKQVSFQGAGVEATLDPNNSERVVVTVQDQNPGISVEDESSDVGAANAITEFDFQGAGVEATLDPGNPAKVIVTVQDQGNADTVGISVEDEGTRLGSEDTVDTLNFTGTGVEATRTGNEVEVDIAAGGGTDLTVQREDAQTPPMPEALGNDQVDTLYFKGDGVTATRPTGTNTVEVDIAGGGTDLKVQEEDNMGNPQDLGTDSLVDTLYFKGDGVAATRTGNTVELDIPGGSTPPDLSDLNDFKDDTEIYQEARKNSITAVANARVNVAFAGTQYTFTPDVTIPTLDYASAYFRFSVNYDGDTLPNAIELFAISRIPEVGSMVQLSTTNSSFFRRDATDPDSVVYFAKRSNGTLVFSGGEVGGYTVIIQKVEVAIPVNWGTRGDDTIIPLTKIPQIPNTHLPPDLASDIAALEVNQPAIIDAILENGRNLGRRRLQVTVNAADPTHDTPIVIQRISNTSRLADNIKILKAQISAADITYLQQMGRGSMVGIADFAGNRLVARDTIWINEVASVTDTQDYVTLNFLQITERAELPNVDPYLNTAGADSLADAIYFSNTLRDSAKLEEILNAFMSSGWVDAGANAATDPWVADIAPSTTVPNDNAIIHGYTYVQNRTTGTHLSGAYYIFVRIPLSENVRVATGGFRLDVGDDVYTLSSSSWERRGGDAAYAYYSVRISNIPATTPYRVQTFERFSIDSSKLQLTSRNLSDMPSNPVIADNGKVLTWDSSEDSYALGTPMGGGGIANWEQNDSAGVGYIQNRPDVGTSGLQQTNYDDFDVLGDFGAESDFQIEETLTQEQSSTTSVQIETANWTDVNGMGLIYNIPPNGPNNEILGLIPTEGLFSIQDGNITIARPTTNWAGTYRLRIRAGTVNVEGFLAYTALHIFLIADYRGLGTLDLYRGPGGGTELAKLQNGVEDDFFTIVSGSATNVGENRLTITSWSLGTNNPIGATERFRVVSSNDGTIIDVTIMRDRGVSFLASDMEGAQTTGLFNGLRTLPFHGTNSMNKPTGTPSGSYTSSNPPQQIFMSVKGVPIRGVLASSSAETVLYADVPPFLRTNTLNTIVCSLYVNGMVKSVTASGFVGFQINGESTSQSLLRFRFTSSESIIDNATTHVGISINVRPDTESSGIDPYVLQMVQLKNPNHYFTPNDRIVVQKDPAISNETDGLLLKDIIPRYSETTPEYRIRGDLVTGVNINFSDFQPDSTDSFVGLMGTEGARTFTSGSNERAITGTTRIRITYRGRRVEGVVAIWSSGGADTVYVCLLSPVGKIKAAVTGNVGNVNELNSDLSGRSATYRVNSQPSLFLGFTWNVPRVNDFNFTLRPTDLNASVRQSLSVSLVEQITDPNTVQNRHIVPQEGLIIDDAIRGIQRTVGGQWINLQRKPEYTRIVATNTNVPVGSSPQFITFLNVTDILQEFDTIILGLTHGFQMALPLDNWRATARRTPNFTDLHHLQEVGTTQGNTTEWLVRYQSTLHNQIRISRVGSGTYNLYYAYGIKYRYGFFIP